MAMNDMQVDSMTQTQPKVLARLHYVYDGAMNMPQQHVLQINSIIVVVYKAICGCESLPY